MIAECPALVDAAIWEKVQVRMRERATGPKARSGVRRNLLLRGVPPAVQATIR